MQRKSNALNITYWVIVGSYAIQIALSAIYACYALGLASDVRRFGWGAVPQENMHTFLWLSENLGPFADALAYLTIPVFLMLVYQTAVLLDRLGIKQHLGAGLTTISLFIPIYSFYRPWAGLGEVSNTLTAATERGSIPFAGLRGLNIPTLIFALSLYAYFIANKALGFYADGIANRTPSDQITGLAYLGDLSNTMLGDAFVKLVFAGIILWYWGRIIRQYKECVLFPNAPLIIPETSEPTPTRDILQVGTRPAL